MDTLPNICRTISQSVRRLIRHIALLLIIISPLLVTVGLWLFAAALIYLLVDYVGIRFSYAVMTACSLSVIVILVLASLFRTRISR